MILDKDLEFSTAQAVTAAAASTNYIDTAPLATGNLGRDIGDSDGLYVYAVCTVAMTDSGSDSTLAVTVETDDNTSFSSATTLATLFTFPAVSAAGTKLFAKLPPGAAYERYIQLRYTPANGNLSTGTFTAGLTKNIDKFKAYASGFTTGI